MNVDKEWGFGIPIVAVIMAIIFFLIVSKWFRLQLPKGSIITRICHVVLAICRKYRLYVPDNMSLLYDIEDAEFNIKGSCKLEHTIRFEVCLH